MKSQEAKQLLSLDWDFATGQHIGQHTGYHAQKNRLCFSLKLFHFCLRGCWHFWFQSGTFSYDFQVPSSRFSIVSARSAFIFLAIVCFPELLHTQRLHKFVGSISGVVSMNTACIMKMILEWILLGRPLCHRCKNFKALCRYTFVFRMSRMFSRWRVLSVCLCNVPITVGQNVLMFVRK